MYNPSMALISSNDAARRLARAIASDLSVYNEDKILQGIQNDNLFEVLNDEIEEGRDLFRSRVTPEIFSTNVYERALIEILLKTKGHVASPLW